MRIMTIPCDGIGPEIMSASLGVLNVVDKRFDLGFSFHEEEAGFDSLKNHGITPVSYTHLTLPTTPYV